MKFLDNEIYNFPAMLVLDLRYYMLSLEIELKAS